MKLVLKSLTMVAALATGSAFAQQHELHGGSNAGITLTEEASPGAGSGFNFSGSVGYRYQMDDMFQIGGRLGFGFVKDGNTDFGVEVGPVLNFGEFTDAIYVGLYGSLDFTKPQTGDSSSTFGIDAFVGKRFAIAQNVSWSPELAFDMGFGDSGNWQFVGRLVNISVLF